MVRLSAALLSITLFSVTFLAYLLANAPTSFLLLILNMNYTVYFYTELCFLSSSLNCLLS